MTEYALRLDNGQDTATRMRVGDALGLIPGSDQLSARAGLRYVTGAGRVTVVEGTMAVEVEPFAGWVAGTVSGAQGGYPFVLDATKTLTLADGDPSLSRTDTIVARVQHDAYDGSGVTQATVEVVQGTPGGGAPALPDSSIALRDVTVPATVSAGTGGLTGSNLGADRRTWTAAAGAVVNVRDATDRDSMSAEQGQPVWRLDTQTLEVLDGTSWRQVWPVESPGFMLKRSTIQNVANADATAAVWQSAVRDDLGVWSSGSTVTITQSGWYVVSGGYWIQSTGPAAGQALSAHLIHNGMVVASGGGMLIGNQDAGNRVSVSTPLYLQAGDTLRLDMMHNAGETLSAGGSREGIWLRGVRTGG